VSLIRDTGTAVGQEKAVKTWGEYTFIKRKSLAIMLVFIPTTMLTSRTTPEIMENLFEASRWQIAAISLFQFDLGKPWNYLRYFHKKAPPPPLPRRYLPTYICFENCFTKPARWGRPIYCSAVPITKSYVLRWLGWATVFITAIANVCNCFD